MLPQPARAPQSPRRIGVGIDTSRYGHYAAFLRDDLQPAAELAFPESAAGYALLRQRLEGIAQRHGPVHFGVRLDAADQYAENLLHFLHRLATPAPGAAASATPLLLTISCGDPQRNQNYRAALFGGQKSDPVEARAAARFAVTERPARDMPLSLPLRILRQVAGRLQAVVRQRTRLVNQFHHLLALTYPELALLTKDLAAGWVLELVPRFPTAGRLAEATPADLDTIPYLPAAQAAPLLEPARNSVASLGGPAAEELVRDHVRQLRAAGARHKRLENLLVSADRGLPRDNHLASIPGIGDVTAAVLTAVILDIDRLATSGQLVAYLGVLPVEASSGVDREGQPRGPRRYGMSRSGNDLARRSLWMAALSAVRCNPAVRALYARVVAKHPRRKAVAIGHARRQLVQLAFAIGKSGRPFDPDHYPWQGAHPERSDSGMAGADGAGGTSRPGGGQAAGHRPDAKPAEQVVTAACADSGAGAAGIGAGTFIDFAHLKQQPMARVLDQLGLSARRRGSGAPWRCACPLHRGDARGRTFRVTLEENVFHCFDKQCGRKGDVIDRWAAAHGYAGVVRPALNGAAVTNIFRSEDRARGEFRIGGRLHALILPMHGRTASNFPGNRDFFGDPAWGWAPRPRSRKRAAHARFRASRVLHEKPGRGQRRCGDLHERTGLAPMEAVGDLGFDSTGSAYPLPATPAPIFPA